MRAETRELKQVLGSTTQYIIPTFQRDYEWTRDGQWKLLFEDLSDAADRLTDAREMAQAMRQPTALFERNVSPHFLGAIVCEQLPSMTGGIDERAVIDGQQRLTTLMLLARGLLDALIERDSTLVEQVRRLLWNPSDQASTTHQQYKLWPRRKDREIWRAVMDAEPAPSGDHLYEQARRYFAKQATEAMSGDSPTRPEAFAHALSGLFKLVVIDLEANDDAQVIFEVLNGRQTPLSASDLVKNLLFLRQEFSGEADVEDLYDRYWAEFDDPWWKVVIGRGHAARGRRDVVLSAWLTAATGREVNVGHLYGEVRSYLSSDQLSTESVLAEIYDYARAYGRLHRRHPVDQEEIARSYQWINDLGVQTATPLLLWLSTRSPDTLAPHDHARSVSAVESWLLRRAMINATTRTYGRTFTEVLRAAQAADADGEPIAEAVVNALDGVGRTGVWPSDDEILESFTTRRFYDATLSRGRLRLLLSEIDRVMRARNSKTEQGQFDYSSLQIEHVMPQNWQAHWAVEAHDELERMTAEQSRQAHIDHIGNLTLITGSFNSSLRDSAWDIKRSEFLQQSKLQLNSRIAAEESWDENAITARGAELARISNEIWPGPADFISKENVGP